MCTDTLNDTSKLPRLTYNRMRRGQTVESYTPTFLYTDVSLKAIAEMVADAARWGDTVTVTMAGEG